MIKGERVTQVYTAMLNRLCPSCRVCVSILSGLYNVALGLCFLTGSAGM